MRIPESRIRQLVAENWDCEESSRIAAQALMFARLVEKEYERLRAIEDSRMGCLMNGGHEFELSSGGGFSEVTYGSPSVIRGWTGTGQCLNCDAALGVTYREDS